MSFINIAGVASSGRVPTGLTLSDQKVSEVAEDEGVKNVPDVVKTASSGHHFE